MKAYQQSLMDSMSYDLAEISLKLGAFIFKENPTKWESGYWMPAQSNFGSLLYDYNNRILIRQYFDSLRRFNSMGEFDIVAGTSLSAASPATTLADLWQKSLIIVRTKPKDTGNNIAGLVKGQDLDKRKVALIEDRIETGRSSAKAVQMIRDVKGVIDYCFTIFNYGFDEAVQVFDGKKPFENLNKLTSSCRVYSALSYNKLIEVAITKKFFTEEQLRILEEWHADPFHWGENHGFPKAVE